MCVCVFIMFLIKVLVTVLCFYSSLPSSPRDHHITWHVFGFNGTSKIKRPIPIPISDTPNDSGVACVWFQWDSLRTSHT